VPASVVSVIFLCSLSVAGAIYLIVDMEHPVFGHVQVSSAPLHDALEEPGK
jgi:hypothetical protein